MKFMDYQYRSVYHYGCEKLMEAEADIEAGRVKDAHASLSDLRAKYGI